MNSTTYVKMLMAAAIVFFVSVFIGITAIRLLYGGDGAVQAWWNEPLRDVAMAFFPLAVCLIGWEFWLRGARHRETADYLDAKIKDIIVKRLDNVSAVEKSGISKILTEVDPNYLRNFISISEKHINILVPWFVEPKTLEPIFRDKYKQGLNIKIIMLDITSDYLKKRGEVINPGDSRYGRMKAEETLSMLISAFGATHSQNIQVRMYDSLPSAFIAQSDERALLGLHLNTGVALKNPHFEIQMKFDGKDTVLGKMITDEFSKVSDNGFSRCVDLIKTKRDSMGNFSIVFI